MSTKTSAIFSVFPKPRKSASLQNSCYVAASITSQFFTDFLNLSESCREKAVFVQRHNTSLHSKFRQTALKLTPKGLDYTRIDTLREPCLTDLWFWEVLGQSQSWLRTMQNGLVKALYQFSHLWILDLLSKNQTLAHAQKTWLCSFKSKDMVLRTLLTIHKQLHWKREPGVQRASPFSWMKWTKRQRRTPFLCDVRLALKRL